MTITSDKAWSRTLALLTVGAASLALAGCSLLGNVTGGGTTDPGTDQGDDVFSIAPGDCLNDADVTGEVSAVPTVDCAEPHDSEAFYAEDLPDGDFPGSDEINASADTLCSQPFIDFVGKSYDESAYDYTWYSPTAESWGSGDREILCVAYADSLEKMTGSIKGLEK